MERVKGLTWNPKGYWQYAYKPVGRKRTSTKLGGLAREQEAEANQRALEFLEQEKLKEATVSAVIARYRKTQMPKRKKSWQNVDYQLRRIEEKFGPCPFAALLCGEVEDWLLTLQTEDGKEMASGTKGVLRIRFSSLWRYAIKRQLIPGVSQYAPNPMDSVTIPDSSKVQKKTKPLSKETFKGMLTLLKNPYRMIFVLCIPHMLRISECLGLKWLDINWRTGQFQVVRRVVGHDVDETKTERSESELVLHPRTLAELHKWFTESKYQKPEDWIFASPATDGRWPLWARTVARHYLKSGREVGLLRANTHICRHTGRRVMRAKKVPLETQRDAMRHENLATTLRYDDHIMPDEAIEAQGLVADYLYEAMDEIALENESGNVQ